MSTSPESYPFPDAQEVLTLEVESSLAKRESVIDSPSNIPREKSQLFCMNRLYCCGPVLDVVSEKPELKVVYFSL